MTKPKTQMISLDKQGRQDTEKAEITEFNTISELLEVITKFKENLTHVG